MQQEKIEQLDRAIAEVFSLMLDRDCNPTPCSSAGPFAESGHLQPSAKPHDGISASIAFSGSMRGACSIHLTLLAAAAITHQLVGPLPDCAVGDLSADTIGEICNMIAGNWKSRQSSAHAACDLSIPLVTHATPHVTPTQASSPESPIPFRNTLVRVYSFEDHCLHLELGFD